MALMSLAAIRTRAFALAYGVMTPLTHYRTHSESLRTPKNVADRLNISLVSNLAFVNQQPFLPSGI